MQNGAPDFRQIMESLSEGLMTAFREVCPKRYGDPLSLRHVDSSADWRQAHFVIEAPGAESLDLRITVGHVGGNVYDITTKLEDEPTLQFTHSEPNGTNSSPVLAPKLAENIANHILDQTEQRLGKRFLSSKKLQKTS